MNKRLSKLGRLLCLLSLAVWAAAPRASAQTNPVLTLEVPGGGFFGGPFVPGLPVLTLTGVVGTVYSIQITSTPWQTNSWTQITLLQARTNGSSWTDPSGRPTIFQRYYRAVSIASPGNTNLVFIQPGTFIMGSPTNEALHTQEETQHRVRISKGFWMEKYPVTQGQYLDLVGMNPSYFTPGNGYPDDPTLPVEEVSWFDALNYCEHRTQQEQAAGLLSTNYAYRLPTEAEWEYVARAGTSTAYYLGNALHSGQANFDGLWEYNAAVGQINNTNGIYLKMTTPVGSYAPNPWGLYDFIGNVGEWCSDWYGPMTSDDALDPQGPVSGSGRLVRGGDWNAGAWMCRSSFRVNGTPTIGYFIVGFRVVLAPIQP